MILDDSIFENIKIADPFGNVRFEFEEGTNRCKRCGALLLETEKEIHLGFHQKLLNLELDVKDFMDEWRKKRR